MPETDPRRKAAGLAKGHQGGDQTAFPHGRAPGPHQVLDGQLEVGDLPQGLIVALDLIDTLRQILGVRHGSAGVTHPAQSPTWPGRRHTESVHSLLLPPVRTVQLIQSSCRCVIALWGRSACGGGHAPEWHCTALPACGPVLRPPLTLMASRARRRFSFSIASCVCFTSSCVARRQTHLGLPSPPGGRGFPTSLGRRLLSSPPASLEAGPQSPLPEGPRSQPSPTPMAQGGRSPSPLSISPGSPHLCT